MRTDQKQKLKKMCIAAVFTALAFAVTCVFHIKVVFLSFEFKDAVIFIGSIICGPIYAVIMPVIVALIEFVTISDTGVYGLVMNILASVAFSLPACLIYNFRRTLKSAILGLATGVFTVTAVMMVANLLITPYYYHMDVAGVAQMIPTLLLPFNLTKSLLNAGVVMLLYKGVVTSLRRARLIDLTDRAQSEKNRSKKSTVIMTVCAAALIILSLVIFFLVLGGDITFGVEWNWNK